MHGLDVEIRVAEWFLCYSQTTVLPATRYLPPCDGNASEPICSLLESKPGVLEAAFRIARSESHLAVLSVAGS